MKDREYIQSDLKAFMREMLESLKGQGYSPFLKSKDNPEGKTDGLTAKTLNKILMKIASSDDELSESLRDWFKKEKWVRISSSGNIAGPCGTSKNKKNPDRCLPKAKAQSLSKAQRAATARKKKKAGAKGQTVVKNTKAAKVTRENLREGIGADYLEKASKYLYNGASFQDTIDNGYATNPADVMTYIGEKETNTVDETLLADWIESNNIATVKIAEYQYEEEKYNFKQFKGAAEYDSSIQIYKMVDKETGQPVSPPLDGSLKGRAKYSKVEPNKKYYYFGTTDRGTLGGGFPLLEEKHIKILKSIADIFDVTETVTRENHDRSWSREDMEIYVDETLGGYLERYLGYNPGPPNHPIYKMSHEQFAAYIAQKMIGEIDELLDETDATIELIRDVLEDAYEERKKIAIGVGHDPDMHFEPEEEKIGADALGMVLTALDKMATPTKLETANPQDGKAAPYGSGYKKVKEMKVTKEDIRNLMVGLIHEHQQKEDVLNEDDRCTRIAKQKYDTWPSAYASGAVVRCRRGEIWKKK